MYEELDVSKTLFLVDMLEIGRRKYTNLRHQLLSSDVYFPEYHKIVEQKNGIILRKINLSVPFLTATVICQSEIIYLPSSVTGN